MAVKRIDLNQFLMESSISSGDILFEDKLFRRCRLQVEPCDNTSIDILTDSVLSSRVHHHFCSCHSKSQNGITFIFENSKIIENSKGIFVLEDGSFGMMWFPKGPVLRVYDNQERIISSRQSYFITETQDSCVRLAIPESSDGRIEFPVLRFETDREVFLDEINNSSQIEELKVTKAGWFFYEKINDVWDYFIGGYIYKTRHKSVSRAWRCQQQANTLYNYVNYLGEKTRKTIYSVLCDIIAYSIMISLPEDGRWRQGAATDVMETHTRHQLEGIHLLLSYNEKTHQQVFLEKAQQAMDYLISLSDKLADGSVWFLHDSLESNAEDYALRYEDSFQTMAFGKSTTNTLCLNTHLWTLIALYRMNQIKPESRYRECYESGVKSLRTVLQSRRGWLLYWLVYRLWDFLVSCSLRTKRRFINKLRWKYDQILRNNILPRLKKKFPRLYMPNGFIERDLGCSVHSNGYHFINIRDLMLFYVQAPQPWLLPIIKKSVHYTIHGPLVKFISDNEPRTMKILEVINLYAEFVDKSYVSYMAEYLYFFQSIGNAFPADVLSHPQIGPFTEKIISTKQIYDIYNV